jgi:hypothetical protein
MNNFTEQDKKDLQTYIETNGRDVSTVAYDTSTIVGNPEAGAIADGWVQYYKETNGTLVEVIYTKPF